MASRLPLPSVQMEHFLAGTGFVGFRCVCGYVATGRSSETVDSAMRDHVNHLHGESETEDTIAS